MTVQEAIKTCFGKPYVVDVDKHEEAIKTIKEALKELEQYRALEEKLNGISINHIVNAFIERVEKDTNEGYEKGRILTNAEADMWEQYRALGTVDELKHLKEMNKNCTIEQLTGVECSYNETGCSDCKGKQALLEAMEKQVAKKMLDSGERIPFSYYCPTCKTELTDDGYKYDGKYCFECGQRLESEEE